jgi:hypothetical protein
MKLYLKKSINREGREAFAKVAKIIYYSPLHALIDFKSIADKI